VFTLSLFDGDEQIFSIETREKSVSFPLGFVKKPSVIRAVLSVGEYRNSWNIFVYTDEDCGENADNGKFNLPIITEIGDEFERLTQNGGKAIFMMNNENLLHPIEGLFKPAFWSPAHFPSDRACGVMCDAHHKIFEKFPTGEYADFQWKHPIDNSVGADVSVLDADFKYIVEPVPNFYNNIRRSPLFEARVKNADILFCGFDLDADNTTVKALKNSILSYAVSDGFSPKQELTQQDIKKLFK
jgi:hypothetical protein